VTWSWECLPSEQHVTAGAPANFLAAEALYLDGASWQGAGEPMRYLDVAGGLLTYYLVPCLELVVVCQVTSPV
jgi:hypothetical protein